MLEGKDIGVRWKEWYEGKVGGFFIPPVRVLNQKNMVFECFGVCDRRRSRDRSSAIGGVKSSHRQAVQNTFVGQGVHLLGRARSGGAMGEVLPFKTTT